VAEALRHEPRPAEQGRGITRLTPLADLPELLRVEEAAAFLDISKGLVYSLARSGDLPSVKLGRLLRIRREGLEAAR
jgi:excisionase family DNA binding protein